MVRTIKLHLREENHQSTIVMRVSGHPTRRHSYSTRAEAELALRRALDVAIGLHFEGVATEIHIAGKVVPVEKAA